MKLPPPVVVSLPKSSKTLMVALSASGDRMAVAWGSDVAIYDLSAHDPVECYRGQTRDDMTGRPRFAPDGSLWVGVDQLDMKSGAWTQRLHLNRDDFHDVGDLAFLPDGRIAKQVLGGAGHAVALFAPRGEGYELQLVTEAKRVPHDALLAVSHDGANAALSDDYVHLFDCKTGKAWKRLPGHKVHHGTFACFCSTGLLFTRDPPGSSYFDKRYHVQLMLPKGKRAFDEGRTFDVSGVDLPLGLAVSGGHLFGMWQTATHPRQAAVRAWEIATGAEIIKDEVGGELQALVVSLDGGTLAAPSWSSVHIFRL